MVWGDADATYRTDEISQLGSGHKMFMFIRRMKENGVLGEEDGKASRAFNAVVEETIFEAAGAWMVQSRVFTWC